MNASGDTPRALSTKADSVPRAALWADLKSYSVSSTSNMMDFIIFLLKYQVGSGTAADFEFKWNDNMTKEGDIMDFYVSGDTAPFGRFNFVYSAK